MQPPVHTAISVIGGSVVWSITGEPWSMAIAFVSVVLVVVLVDVDYLLYKTNCVSKILHAWEWFLILDLMVVVLGFPWWRIASVVGYGLHIISDQISHDRGKFWYFLSFRVWVLPNRIRKH